MRGSGDGGSGSRTPIQERSQVRLFHSCNHRALSGLVHDRLLTGILPLLCFTCYSWVLILNQAYQRKERRRRRERRNERRRLIHPLSIFDSGFLICSWSHQNKCNCNRITRVSSQYFLSQQRSRVWARSPAYAKLIYQIKFSNIAAGIYYFVYMYVRINC
jgi:hypothetical protein